MTMPDHRDGGRLPAHGSGDLPADPADRLQQPDLAPPTGDADDQHVEQGGDPEQRENEAQDEGKFTASPKFTRFAGVTGRKAMPGYCWDMRATVAFPADPGLTPTNSTGLWSACWRHDPYPGPVGHWAATNPPTERYAPELSPTTPKSGGDSVAQAHDVGVEDGVLGVHDACERGGGDPHHPEGDGRALRRGGRVGDDAVGLGRRVQPHAYPTARRHPSEHDAADGGNVQHEGQP